MLAERKKRLFELYEDGHIAREEFLEQKDILNIQIQRVEEDKNRCNDKLADGDTLVSYELECVLKLLSDRCASHFVGDLAQMSAA